MNPNSGTRAPTNPRTVLITGASAGIGEAFAEVFAAEGFDLVLVARREERLRAVAERLTSLHGVATHVLVADLSDPSASAHIETELSSARGLHIDALVNNAGYGVPGVFLKSDWPRHAANLQVMVMTLAELTHRLLPGMLARGYGRIINVASLAGLVPASAGHTTYGASKAFVIKFSESLHQEVSPKGVHVTALCPGFTWSEFHDVTGTRDRMNQLPPWMWMDAPAVARQGYDAVMAGTPIYVNGRVNRTIAAMVRVAPMSLIRAIERRIGHRKL
ncbi:MAG TPA: SDR family oxidoreductase [Vicinamibacterales bacterium]|nr:SDR family oxidoreductase [Vicinamibacterales bacterium]